MGTGYTRTVVKELEFQGKPVQIAFKRLSRAQMLRIQAFYRKQGDGTLAIPAEDMAAFYEAVDDVIQSKLLSLAGLVIDEKPWAFNAAAATDEDRELLSEIISASYFMKFMGDVLGAITSASSPEGFAPEKTDASTSSAPC